MAARQEGKAMYSDGQLLGTTSRSFSVQGNLKVLWGGAYYPQHDKVYSNKH